MIGLMYMAYPNGCRHEIFVPAEAKALLHEGASVLVNLLQPSCLAAHSTTGLPQQPALPPSPLPHNSKKMLLMPHVNQILDKHAHLLLL